MVGRRLCGHSSFNYHTASRCAGLPAESIGKVRLHPSLPPAWILQSSVPFVVYPASAFRRGFLVQSWNKRTEALHPGRRTTTRLSRTRTALGRGCSHALTRRHAVMKRMTEMLHMLLQKC